MCKILLPVFRLAFIAAILVVAIFLFSQLNVDWIKLVSIFIIITISLVGFIVLTIIIIHAYIDLKIYFKIRRYKR